MSSPVDYLYTPTHEWIKQEGDILTIGITRFAVDELSDVTFIELPAVGRKVAEGASFGEIESVKTTSELYAPVEGEVVAVNEDVKKEPSLINDDPYTKGWLIKLKSSAKPQGLMTAAEYDKEHNIT
ncbi:MAG: glycine cleavage system protein GcvH [Phycisphaerae bacterium]